LRALGVDGKTVTDTSQVNRISGAARDLIGYGRKPPSGKWPNGARLAISFVVNYEEGSERSFAMGDPGREPLTEWGSYPVSPNIRNLAMESMNEYGSRVGVRWLIDIFSAASAKSTFFARAIAFEQNPEVAKLWSKTGTRSAATVTAGRRCPDLAERRSGSASAWPAATVPKGLTT
jgi:hypothetical protein